MDRKAQYLYKSSTMEVKDVDTKSGIVCGYFAAFGNVDSYGDMIMPGAFTKTISERGPNGTKQIKHVLQHDAWQPIGNIQLLKEDSIGLYFESKMSATQKGQDILIQYSEGIYNEHSIGYRTMKEERVDDANGNFQYYKLTELKLWEGSTVLWGANDKTPVVGFKSIDEKRNHIEGRIKKCLSAMKLGQLSDDTLSAIEQELLKMQTEIKSLTEPTGQDTRKPTMNWAHIAKELSI